MSTVIRIPRLNANDDLVKVVRIAVKPGDKIAPEAVLAEIETEKTVVEVAAPSAGYVLRIAGTEEQMLPVGAILMWLGDSPDEAVPAEEAAPAPAGGTA